MNNAEKFPGPENEENEVQKTERGSEEPRELTPKEQDDLRKKLRELQQNN